MLDVGDLAGLVLKVVDLAGLAGLDHLLPSPREQLTKGSQENLVTDRIDNCAALSWSPPGRYGAGQLDVRVQVERHLGFSPRPAGAVRWPFVITFCQTVSYPRSPSSARFGTLRLTISIAAPDNGL